MVKEQKKLLQSQRNVIISRDLEIDALNDRILNDSTMYFVNVIKFQTLIKELNERNAKNEDALLRCEAGLDCWQKTIFGKWKKIECPTE